MEEEGEEAQQNYHEKGKLQLCVIVEGRRSFR